MKRCSKGFTLIEMMIVVVIIAILAMAVFKIAGMSQEYIARTKTMAKVQKLCNAIEAYRSHYGTYPPVPVYGDSQPVAYEYAARGTDENPLMSANTANAIKNAVSKHGTELADEDWEGLLFKFGLMSFLVNRYSGRAEQSWDACRDSIQWTASNTLKERDDPDDEAAVESWSPMLDGLLSGGWTGREYGGQGYTNLIVTVRDAWDRSLRYECPPPYLSYKVWSVGPDGKSGTADDVGEFE